MNDNLAQFGDDLRVHLLRLQVSVENLNDLFSEMASEAHLARRLAELQASASENSHREIGLRETFEACLEREAGISPETVAAWTSKRQSARLHARADLLELSAVVAAELACLAAARAEYIAISAIVGRREAVAVQIQRDEGLDHRST